MTILLTENGIKPTSITRLDKSALADITDLANQSPGNECAVNSIDSYREAVTRDGRMWQAVTPFSEIGLAVASGFQSWGAEIKSIRQQMLLADLEPGDLTINAAGTYHVDYEALQLGDGDEYCVRVLCATSKPPKLLDMTSSSSFVADMQSLRAKTQPSWAALNNDFDEEKIDAYAETKGSFVEPSDGDVVIFDGKTIHKAFAAIERHYRALLNVDIKMIMPDDTMARIRQGDHPQFKLAACQL